jgi:hypothetical protein
MAEPLIKNRDYQTPVESTVSANPVANNRKTDIQPRYANDNLRSDAANDNTSETAPAPESVPLKLSNPNRVITTYNKPKDNSNGGASAAVGKLGTTANVAGAGVQVAGKGMQVAGKGMNAAGKGMMRAGTALSSTGLGAIVGVPLAAVGAGAQVAGKGTEVAGRVTNSAGKRARQAGRAVRKASGGGVSRVARIMGTKTKDDEKATPARLSLRRKIEADPTGKLQQRYLNKATNLIPNPVARGAAKFALKNVERVKTAAVTIEIFAWATPLWLGFQMPLAVLSLILFSIISVIDIDLGFAADTLFSGLFFVVFIIGFVTMISMAFQYVWAGAHCFFGKGALLKFGSFVIGMFFYMMPFLNLFPWFMVWAFFVNRYPE